MRNSHKDSELLACDVECRLEGVEGFYLELDIPGLDELIRGCTETMTPKILMPSFALLWLALVGPQSSAAGEHEHPAPEKLGIVQFPNSCSADVQQEFERAVALLHSFVYSAAEKAFRVVIAKEPDCAMAHWGVAMTYFHQLWSLAIRRNVLQNTANC